MRIFHTADNIRISAGGPGTLWSRPFFQIFTHHSLLPSICRTDIRLSPDSLCLFYYYTKYAGKVKCFPDIFEDSPDFLHLVQWRHCRFAHFDENGTILGIKPHKMHDFMKFSQTSAASKAQQGSARAPLKNLLSVQCKIACTGRKHRQCSRGGVFCSPLYNRFHNVPSAAE